MAESSTSNDTEQFASRSALALRDLEQRARSALASSREQASRLETEVTAQLEALAATLASERAAESENAAGLAQVRSDLDRVSAEYERAKAEWLAERNAFEASRDEAARQSALMEAEQRDARAEWARQLTEFENKLREQQADWNAQRSEWAATRTEIEADRDSLQQKSELTLHDLHRYRDRVAELEQDLARRPVATQADSPEVVALRAERDALIERVELLEQQPATQVDPSAEQQMADLQRRFELAVEDVRELKTKNALLESQLASASNQPARGADSGGMDWESQKRRLLASLEGEGEGDEIDEPARQQERVRIASTIEMTDAIVAEKDKEIAELKSQLANVGPATPADDGPQQRINELLNADEVIAEHRRRIAQLERDTEAALRAAELELSLERAKVARDRAEIDEMSAELEAYRQAIAAPGATPPGAPRRRWLSKLGLAGDDA